MNTAHSTHRDQSDFEPSNIVREHLDPLGFAAFKGNARTFLDETFKGKEHTDILCSIGIDICEYFRKDKDWLPTLKYVIKKYGFELAMWQEIQCILAILEITKN